MSAVDTPAPQVVGVGQGENMRRLAWRRRALFLGVGFLLIVLAPAVMSGFRLGLLAK
jgi:hypothetical protein